jgi:ArsR family transcriptional regulator
MFVDASSHRQPASLQPAPMDLTPSTVALPRLQARAGEAAALLKTLANPDRLLLLCHLVGGERGVGELGASTGIEQPSLSQQLGVLRGERLVATRRVGKQVIYRIASPAALAVLAALYGVFCDPARATPAVQAVPARPGTVQRANKKTS